MRWIWAPGWSGEGLFLRLVFLSDARLWSLWGLDAAPSTWLAAERKEMGPVRLPVDRMAP